MKIIILGLLFTLSAQAKPLRVLMIDAGLPEETQFYGSSVGSDISIEKRKTHLHATATYKFIMSGDCTNVSCLKPVCNEMIVDWCTFLDKDVKEFDDKAYYHCLNKAIKQRYDIVNMSLSGGNFVPLEKEKILQLAKHSIVVVAAGNEGRNIRGYPASFATSTKGPIYAISAIYKDGRRLSTSNKDDLTIDFLGSSYYYNTSTGYWRSIEGTSIAAALYTNKLVREMCPSRKD